MTTPLLTPALEEILGNLQVRFLSSLSPAEMLVAERLFFQLEQSWWFYEDQIADKTTSLPHFHKFEPFARLMWDRIHPPSSPSGGDTNFSNMYLAFKDYQHRIPVYGGILLNADLSKVLLITGYRSKGQWGFPKGKINQNEDEYACGLREVYEEVGFDASGIKINLNHDFIQHSSKSGKFIKLFIIPNVPEDFHFEPRVVKEIGEIKWWRLDELPPDKVLRQALNPNATTKEKSNKFWGAAPFIPRLREWVAKKLQRRAGSGAMAIPTAGGKNLTNAAKYLAPATAAAVLSTSGIGSVPGAPSSYSSLSSGAEELLMGGGGAPRREGESEMDTEGDSMVMGEEEEEEEEEESSGEAVDEAPSFARRPVPSGGTTTTSGNDLVFTIDVAKVMAAYHRGGASVNVVEASFS